MQITKNALSALTAAAVLSTAGAVGAAVPRDSTVGVGGYDLVSYHSAEKPQRGNGNHVVTHDGVAYLFASEANKETFAAAPDKYLPAFGGWCAYGIAVEKKFVGDPDVWEIVDGRLYLNLDNKVQKKWREDIRGNIAKAVRNWKQIRDRSPSDL